MPGQIQSLLFPSSPRSLPHTRAWNIASRTAHIGVTGVLFGGHVFDVAVPQLRIWLYLSILTGGCLVGLEAFPSCRWIYQGRGVAVIAKVLLLVSILWLWDVRVVILAIVVVIASVGSHMSARYRYYSFRHGRVLD
jgi:hypothetical protein